MNTYAKYAPNVFLAKCAEQHKKGDVINVATKYGKENECIVHNLILVRGGFLYYSITRADGFNTQKWAEKRAGKYENAALKSESKSDEYYKKSNKDKDFLSLMEPIKIGHHSEKRHRKVVEDAWNNMGKSVEFSKKAEEQEGKAEYWASRANDINLSMPESLEYYEYKLEEAKEKHEGFLSGKYPRTHSFSLTYAKKEVNELTKKVEMAKKLWA
jgi:hypothetical protein